MIYTDPEALARDKSAAINQLRDAADAAGYRYHSEFFAKLLHDDDARVALGEPSQIDPLARDYLEGFRTRRTPEQREQARTAAQEQQFAQEQARTSWDLLMSNPVNVYKLIRFVDSLPTPEPPVAPWLRKP